MITPAAMAEALAPRYPKTVTSTAEAKTESIPTLLKGQSAAVRSCWRENGDSSARETRMGLANPPQRAQTSSFEVPAVCQPVQSAHRVAPHELQRHPASAE